MDPETLWSIITQGGIAAFAVIGLWAFLSGKIHSDKEFQRLIVQLEKYEQIILSSLNTTEKIIDPVDQMLTRRLEVLESQVRSRKRN